MKAVQTTYTSSESSEQSVTKLVRWGCGPTSPPQLQRAAYLYAQRLRQRTIIIQVCFLEFKILFPFIELFFL